MKPAILLVEDEKEIADTLNYALATEGFAPHWVSNGQAALDCLSNNKFVLAVLDVGLPDANGFELLKSIRTSGQDFADLPCLFLTARNEEIDRIIGLEIGADDYVCKPFSPREVVARVKAILKRSNTVQQATKVKENSSTQTNSEFIHIQQKRQILYRGVHIEFTKAEYELMALFLDKPNHVHTRRELIEHVWSDKHPSDDRAIDTHIKTLRAKLKQHNPSNDFIVTHRGHGYSLNFDHLGTEHQQS
ncbi:beta-lactam response regulator transcription factor BlrA [Arenicella sp. 4NH20-0111]|uniref:two-component system response regulator CreB n=1 Tax=Arenicella sp. 4NH20-0111 TaxID=3127648 RepID=UPI0031099046